MRSVVLAIVTSRAAFVSTKFFNVLEKVHMDMYGR
jgi:hypothetical protein